MVAALCVEIVVVDLPFVVSAPPGGAVPEPLTGMLGLMGLSVIGLSVTRRARIA